MSLEHQRRMAAAQRVAAQRQQARAAASSPTVAPASAHVPAPQAAEPESGGFAELAKTGALRGALGGVEKSYTGLKADGAAAVGAVPKADVLGAPAPKDEPASAEPEGPSRLKVADTVWKGEKANDAVRLAGAAGGSSYVDALSAKAEASAGYEASLGGVKAGLKAGAGANLLDVVGKGGKSGAVGKAEAEAQLKLLGAEASGEAEAGWDRDKGEVSAGAKGQVGAYLAKASGKAEGGFRIPFTNIMVGGGVEAGGQIGAGAGGEASASMGAEGFKASLKGSAALGLGGSLGLNFGISKADREKGWLSGGGWW